jgi:hypothetical protein
MLQKRSVNETIGGWVPVRRVPVRTVAGRGASGSESNPRDVHELDDLHELDEEGDAAMPNPEYSDLLDVDWIGRGTDAESLDDDDVSDVHLDLMQSGDPGELEESLNLEFDVGSLLTSVPLERGVDLDAATLEIEVMHSETRDLLLPDGDSEPAVRGDEEIGDDERFPVFDEGAPERPSVSSGEDPGLEGIADEAD